MTPDVWLRKGDGSMVDRAIVAMMDGALRRGCGEPWGRGAERPRAGRRVGRKRGEKPAGTATRSATTYVQRAVAKGDAWSVVCYMGQFAQCQTHAMRTLCDGVALCGTSRSVIYRCDPGRVRGAQPLRLSARALRRNISFILEYSLSTRYRYPCRCRYWRWIYTSTEPPNEFHQMTPLLQT